MCACQLNIAGDESAEKKILNTASDASSLTLSLSFSDAVWLWCIEYIVICIGHRKWICELSVEIRNVKCGERTENASILQECNEWNEISLHTAGSWHHKRVYKVSNQKMFNIIRSYQRLGYRCYHFIHKHIVGM